jgi:uncharacterized membrane protein YeaQ/YmgE (transglycosylase-associated protein family)
MTVAGIITAIVMGLLIGALGRLVVPGKQNIPIWLTIVVGWRGGPAVAVGPPRPSSTAPRRITGWR